MKMSFPELKKKNVSISGTKYLPVNAETSVYEDAFEQADNKQTVILGKLFGFSYQLLSFTDKIYEYAFKTIFNAEKFKFSYGLLSHL